MALDVAILLPVHDDWVAASQVLQALDAELAAHPGWRVQAYLVDDGSSEPPSGLPTTLQALQAVHVLPLRRNLGHQRAIALGLAFLEAQTEAEVVVVMDADGEDRPADVPRLVEGVLASDRREAVFAERRRRTEGLVFRAGYLAYRLLHRLAVGPMQKVGNFSALPRAQLARVVVVSETWNHYAAAVFKSRTPVRLLPADRGRRVHGRSRMNLMALVLHGLSALAVWGELVGVRLLVGCSLLALLALSGAIGVVGWHAQAGVALPSWGAPLLVVVTLVMAQVSTAGFVTAFYLLALRSRLDFVPARDYEVFVDTLQPVARRPDAEPPA